MLIPAEINYKRLFSYNVTEIDVKEENYKKFIDNAISKINRYGKILITIESSASKVPTTTYKTNINLASIRGDEAKAKIMASLKEKGISDDKISISGINSIVSGPNYIGDFKNTEKYKDFQYVKITIK